MPVEVIMPKVDMDMTTGTISAWHVEEGQRVSKGDPLFDIETDKAAMEVEAPASGVLHHVRADAGAEVRIGEAIAWLYAEGEAVGEIPGRDGGHPGPDADAGGGAATGSAVDGTADRRPGNRADAGPSDSAGPEPRCKTRATPLARRMARDSGLDLSRLSGSGPNGRVQRADIDEAMRGEGAEGPVADGHAPVPGPYPAPGGFDEQSGELSVRRTGGGDLAPILMIHGLANDGAGWAAVEEHLPPGHPILKLDLPGHGRSPRRRVADFADLARQVRAAVDDLDIARLHLVGHSLGGAVALALADTRGRSVASLTLIAPAGLGPEIDGHALDGLMRASRAESLGPWMRRLTADPDAVSTAFVRAAAFQRRNPELRAAQAALADAVFPDGTQAFDLRAALGRLDCPARLVWGREDAMIPWRHALCAPGGVSLNLLERVGHLPHIEAPHLVANLISQTIAAAGG